jgi:SEC-C motif-containing protein
VSFGSAATRGPLRLDAAQPCPCGSGDSFGGCCGPVLAGGDAPTAERLMRSRYTAFCVGDAGYLARSWHPRTRPADIDIDPQLRWTGLEIVDAAAGGDGDATGVVEFRAAWVQGSGANAVSGELRERSRFARLRGRWHYLDGEVG